MSHTISGKDQQEKIKKSFLTFITITINFPELLSFNLTSLAEFTKKRKINRPIDLLRLKKMSFKKMIVKGCIYDLRFSKACSVTTLTHCYLNSP